MATIKSAYEFLKNGEPEELKNLPKTWTTHKDMKYIIEVFYLWGLGDQISDQEYYEMYCNQDGQGSPDFFIVETDTEINSYGEDVPTELIQLKENNFKYVVFKNESYYGIEPETMGRHVFDYCNFMLDNEE